MPDDLTALITRAEYALEWGNGDDLHRELVVALKATRAERDGIEHDRDFILRELEHSDAALKAARAEVERLTNDTYYVVAEKQAEVERLQEATDLADSILSLLRYRGLVDSENNRRDVQKASEMLERLRR